MQPESLAPVVSGAAAAGDSGSKTDDTITNSSAHEHPPGDHDGSPATAPKVAAEAEALEPQQPNTGAPPEGVAPQQTPGQFDCQPGLPANRPPPLTKQPGQGLEKAASAVASAECTLPQAAEHLEACADRPVVQGSGAAVNSLAAERATQQGDSQPPLKLEPASEYRISSDRAAGISRQAVNSVSGKPQSQQPGECNGQALEQSPLQPGLQCQANDAGGSEGTPGHSEPALQQPASCILVSERPAIVSKAGVPQPENGALGPEPAADAPVVASQQPPDLGRVSSQPAAPATPPEPLQQVTAAVDTEQAARPAPAPEQQRDLDHSLVPGDLHHSSVPGDLLHSRVPGEQATSQDQPGSTEEAQDPDERATNLGAAAQPLGRPAAEDVVPSLKIHDSLQLDELLGMREELALGIVAWRQDMRCATCSTSWLSRQRQR